MNKKFEKLGFYPADILMPKDCDMTKWAVVACDQFTSEPEYWEAVEKQVGDAPSTLRLILPEANLKAPNVDELIENINTSMKKYMDDGVFKTLSDSLIYVEREQSDGKIRHGLVGMVDLDAYDFTPGSGALIRATEATVQDRIPPRARFVEGISKTIDGVKVLDNISFTVNHDDKIAFVGGNELAKTTLFKILAGELEPDEGSYKWGVTTSQSYFPKDNTAIFDTDELIVDWLTQYSEIKDATYVRGFLGRMLFAGEDGVKKMRVLSGGEKVRVLLSRMMIMGSNVLMFDEPTDHLDMESITALNNGMIKFPGVILFACRDHQVVQTTANRIIEFLPNGSMIDKITTYDEYLESDEMARKRQVYSMSEDDENDN